MTVVGRLAPSPTGLLHLGHARSFLLSYWQARHSNGVVLLRMDDLDQSRCRSQYAQQVIEDLSWLGIEWEGPVTSQWVQRELLRQPALELLQSNQAYSCSCTRAEIQALSAPHAQHLELRYPGTCAAGDREAKAGVASCVRLRIEPGPVEFVDELWGRRRVDVHREVGDFALLNREGVPTYQLATVVNDFQSGVTAVVRGADLLDSTARQVLVARALGYASPSYLHVPLVTDENGRRLAKRHDDLSLARLREMGASASRVVAWALRSAGLDSGKEISANEAIARFDAQRLQLAPTAVDTSVVRELCGRAP